MAQWHLQTVEPFFQWIGVQPHVLWLYEPPHVPGSMVCGKRRGWDLSLLPSDSCLLSRECSQESNNSDKQPLWFERVYFLYLSLSFSLSFLILQSSGWSLIMKIVWSCYTFIPFSFSLIIWGKRSCSLTEPRKAAIWTTYNIFIQTCRSYNENKMLNCPFCSIFNCLHWISRWLHCFKRQYIWINIIHNTKIWRCLISVLTYSQFFSFSYNYGDLWRLLYCFISHTSPKKYSIHNLRFSSVIYETK